MKNLIYFVIGGNPGYNKLLRYVIHSIRSCLANDIYDILVMCDEKYAPFVKDIPYTYLHITDDNINHVHASMRKTEIFAFEHINMYTKVLYLDCDIVVCGALNGIFDYITNDDVLYVVSENENNKSHKQHYFHRKDRPYDEATLASFAQDKIYVFNAGQYGFVVSDNMRAHFEAIVLEKQSYNADLHFFEQSFLNDHFNRSKKVCYDIGPFVKLHAMQNSNQQVTIMHFCGDGIHSDVKLKHMADCHHKYVSQHMPINIDSRMDIAQLVHLPSDAHIAEIGVFKGEYAKFLFDTYNPEKFYLVDPWTGETCSGDQDGNNVQSYQGEALFEEVSQLFNGNTNIEFLRMYSTNIVPGKHIPENSLDMIYIDGDHSYEGVKRDLDLAMRLVKYGGWICGHDYTMNRAKTSNSYDFGVDRAVQEFCRDNDMRVWGLLNDGCVSFVIRK